MLPIPLVKSKETTKHQHQEAIKSTFKATEPSDRPSSIESSGRAASQNESKPTSKPALLKREQSDIFKSFSKPKAKLKKEDTDSSTTVSFAPVAEQAVSHQEPRFCSLMLIQQGARPTDEDGKQTSPSLSHR